MAVANKQVAAATNNSEDLQRLDVTAPEARKNIRIIWTSPIIPLDPLVWRKDLDPAIKIKFYTFIMSYGRIGSPEEIKAAREILANLIWSPFNPSSDNQLLPIRKLELTKERLKVEADSKLSDEEKAKQVAKHHDPTRRHRPTDQKSGIRRLPATRRRLHRLPTRPAIRTS